MIILQESTENECYLSEKKVNHHISLESGNIFLTNYQTITVTVNCTGAMMKKVPHVKENIENRGVKNE